MGSRRRVRTAAGRWSLGQPSDDGRRLDTGNYRNAELCPGLVTSAAHVLGRLKAPTKPVPSYTVPLDGR
jgi:hypothetical protein